MDGKAQVLLAIAVLLIVISVMVTVLSNDNFAKVVSAVTAILGIISGAVAVFRVQAQSSRAG
ncbi:MAG: hypothetical protein M3P16_00570 [Chloroflexota bacterium]|nr:hypothetical protein [Chloroflexota bacterium]